jgi:hypothetical protein
LLMRDRALLLLVPTSPPLVLRIVVVAVLIAAKRLVAYPERPHHLPERVVASVPGAGAPGVRSREAGERA